MNMQSKTVIIQQMYHLPLQKKLQLAEEIYLRHAADFQEHDELRMELALLAEYGKVLDRHMADSGMGKLCVHCAAGPGGGCCSLYMADETDVVQMLMNMLAGVKVRQVRSNGEECCFLGDKGCLFCFKPMFCLNYNCQKILATLSPERKSLLAQLTGRLLAKQYEVEQMLLDLISTRMNK